MTARFQLFFFRPQKIKFDDGDRLFISRPKTMYIVFQDALSGFKHIPQMDAESLEEIIQNSKEGCVGCRNPSQHWMYFIYKKHQENVPIVGTRFDVYKRVKAIAGALVDKPNTNSHEYAMTHNSSTAWFFTDNLFE